MQDQSLAKLDEVLLAIEAATTVQEIKSTIDAAIAIGVYTKQAKMGKDIELKASEYILRAERKLGEMLAAAKATGQIGHGSKSTGENQYKSGVVPKESNTSFTLNEAGIDRKLSSKAQKIAAIPKEDFEKKVAEGKESGKLSSATVMKPVGPKSEVNSILEVTSEMKPMSKSKIAQILEVMKDGQWRTFKEIEESTGGDRRDTGRLLRFLKEPKFGSYIVELRSEGPENEYRVLDREGYNGIEKPDARMPVITRDMLSLTAQKKADLYIKQEIYRLRVSFQSAVQTEVNQRVKLYREEFAAKVEAEQKEAQQIIKNRRGFITLKVWKKIRDCLHPDRALHPARGTDEGMQAAYNECFEWWNRMKRFVLDEKACPTPSDRRSAPLPKTKAEWDAWEEKTTKERKAQYAARKANKNKAVSPA